MARPTILYSKGFFLNARMRVGATNLYPCWHRSSYARLQSGYWTSDQQKADSKLILHSINFEEMYMLCSQLVFFLHWPNKSLQQYKNQPIKSSSNHSNFQKTQAEWTDMLAALCWMRSHEISQVTIIHPEGDVNVRRMFWQSIQQFSLDQSGGPTNKLMLSSQSCTAS